MISRIYVRCQTCRGNITARVQVGHEIEQPVVIACPHCETELRFKLLLDEPPNVGIKWEENSEAGDEEGTIINVGAGFTISRDKLHSDLYFPSMEIFPMLAQRLRQMELERKDDEEGPRYFDTAVTLGTVPYMQDVWKTVHKAWRLHRTGRHELRDQQIALFWGDEEQTDLSILKMLLAFFNSFLHPRAEEVLTPLLGTLDEAFKTNPDEVRRLGSDLSGRWIEDRIDGYVDLLHEYFKGYSDFDQTLVYAKMAQRLTDDRHASSTDFINTRMFYGNAFELLGSHLDLVAAVFNIVSGRPYDQLSQLTLTAYRTINKANRTNCFADHGVLPSLVDEYDSSIRNASHHRWFKLDARRATISYRSGGTGAEKQMTYAEYLYRCNRLLLQIMALACIDLVLLRRCRHTL